MQILKKSIIDKKISKYQIFYTNGEKSNSASAVTDLEMPARHVISLIRIKFMLELCFQDSLEYVSRIYSYGFSVERVMRIYREESREIWL